MKIDDLVGLPGLREALLAPDPSGCDLVVEPGNKESIHYVAIDRATDDELGRLSMIDWCIEFLEVDEDRASAIATFLLRKACAAADKETKSMFVPSETSLAGVAAKRFMERFGFLTNSEGMMERRPGAALPYSVLL